MDDVIEVSVIIAFYNSGKTSGRILQSLKKQTLQGCFEIIVVDSSIDGTVQQIRMDFPEIWVLHFSGRLMPGEARSIGISVARGKIVALLDGDCEADSDWIERVIRAHKSPHPATGGAIANGNIGKWVSWAAYFCSRIKWANISVAISIMNLFRIKQFMAVID